MAEPLVTVEVQMSPEEYVELKKNAEWFKYTVAEYMLKMAQGKIGHGC